MYLCYFVCSLSLFCLDRLIVCVVILHVRLTAHVYSSGAFGEVGNDRTSGRGDHLVTGVRLDIEGSAKIEGGYAAGVNGCISFWQHCDGRTNGGSNCSPAAIIGLIVYTLVVAVLGIGDGEGDSISRQGSCEETDGVIISAPAVIRCIGMVIVVMIGIVTMAAIKIGGTPVGCVVIGGVIAGMVAITAMEAAGAGMVATAVIRSCAGMITAAAGMIAGTAGMITAAAGANYGGMIYDRGMIYDGGMAYARMANVTRGVADISRMADCGRMTDCGMRYGRFAVLGIYVSETCENQNSGKRNRDECM